jgi:hypothetical protein
MNGSRVQPSAAPRTAALAGVRFWFTAAMLLLGPFAGLVLGLSALLVTVIGAFGLIVDLPVFVGAGALIAYAGAAGVLVRRRFAAPAVLLPSLAMLMCLPELDVGGYATLTGPNLLWAGVMAVVLVAVGVTPRPYSWWIGYTGAIAAAWAAVTWSVSLFNAAGSVGLDTSYAWLWFPSAFVRVSLGPGPWDSGDGYELTSWFIVNDFTEIYPHVLLGVGVYAVSYLIGVCHHRDFPE